MAETRSTLKAEAQFGTPTKPGMSKGTAEVLGALNTLLFEDMSRADLSVTMFYMKFNRGNRLLTYANAGHNKPLLLHAGETACLELDADGLILGINKDVTFAEESVVLRKGDPVLLYTDGMTEAQSPAGEFFGVDRLISVFAAQGMKMPQDIISRLVRELQIFCQNSTFADDVSMVVLKVT